MAADKSKKSTFLFIFFLIFCLFVMITLSIVGLSHISQNSYNEKETKEMFAKYNENYKYNADKELDKIVLTFNKADIDKANTAIINYISNAGGKLLSINGKEITSNTSKHLNNIEINSSKKFLIDRVEDWEVKILDTNIYIMLIPKDKTATNSLQEYLDKYLAEEN